MIQRTGRRCRGKGGVGRRSAHRQADKTEYNFNIENTIDDKGPLQAHYIIILKGLIYPKISRQKLNEKIYLVHLNVIELTMV